MTKKVNVKPTDFSKYFKGLDLKKRISVMETAKTLLDLQEGNETLLADVPPMEAEKKEKA
ncbi:MAG: hypothetical protein LBL56_07540 [Treponema sp.]|jgi:hypothetical protein|nr:hypothetical protein [Treponema sp.]